MIRYILLSAVLLFCPACRTIHSGVEYNVNKREVPSGDPRLQAVGESLLRSIRDNDYPGFLSAASGYGEEMTKEDFELSGKNIRDQFGEIAGYEYLTDLELPLLHNLLWKVRFERQGKQTEKIRQELLFRLVLGTQNGNPRVISMGFL